MRNLVAVALLSCALACSSGSQSGSSCPASAPLDCMDGKCCPSGYPFHCATTGHCFDTASAAQNECGSSYNTCAGPSTDGGTGGGSDGGTTGGSDGGTTGGSSGDMGACGTCSGQLECSQWISGTNCNWQSCACYFTLNGSDTWKEYYHSSDNQCFQCSTTGTTCQSAAQSLVNHCY